MRSRECGERPVHRRGLKLAAARVAIALWLGLAAARGPGSALAADDVQIEIHSDPGVLAWQFGSVTDHSFATPEDQFIFQHDVDPRGIEFLDIIFGPTDWGLTFSSLAWMPLGPGVYDDVQEAFLQSPKRGGISITTNGYGFCGDVDFQDGWFVIEEAEFGSDRSVVLRLAVDFEVHCHQQPGGVFGSVRVNSSVPIPTPRPVPVPDPSKATLELDGPGIIGGPTKVDWSNATFLTRHGYGAVRFYVYRNTGEAWTLVLAAPRGPVCSELLPGGYDDAEPYVSAAPGHPGMDFDQGSVGCGLSWGRFLVLESVYDRDGQIQKFAADFEHHCERFGLPSYGKIRYEVYKPTPTPLPPTPTPLPGSPAWYIEIQSDWGDFVAGCQPRLLTEEDGLVQAFHEPGHVYVHYDGGANWWTFELAAPAGLELLPGTYEGATRFPFQAPEEPGLDVYGQSRGCNMSFGKFVVLDADYGPDGEVRRFEADVEQHCEGVEAALYAKLRLGSTTPLPTVTATIAPPATDTPTPTPTFTPTETFRPTPTARSLGGGGCAAGGDATSESFLWLTAGALLALRKRFRERFSHST